MPDNKIKFGLKYRNLPTPQSVILLAKLIQRLIGGAIAIVPLVVHNETASQVISVSLGAFIACSRDIEEYFGAIVHSPSVPTKDVEVIKDEAIKIIIFMILVNTYLFIF
jgi:hypothetical protein